MLSQYPAPTKYAWHLVQSGRGNLQRMKNQGSGSNMDRHVPAPVL